VIGAPAQATLKNKEAIMQAARSCVDSVMLCSEPFAVAYGLDMLDDVLVIDIGAGTTDLCRMRGTMPEEFGPDHQHLRRRLGRRAPVRGDPQGRAQRRSSRARWSKALKERHSNVSANAPAALVELPVGASRSPSTSPMRSARPAAAWSRRSSTASRS